VLLRLAYLGVTNAFALLRLLSVGDHDKDIEILALRHQITVLQRQLGNQKPRFEPAERALLAALLHRLPRPVLRELRLLVRPRTILRWQCAARRLVVSPSQMGGTWRNVSGSDGFTLIQKVTETRACQESNDRA
jgi:putative transposase